MKEKPYTSGPKSHSETSKSLLRGLLIFREHLPIHGVPITQSFGLDTNTGRGEKEVEKRYIVANTRKVRKGEEAPELVLTLLKARACHGKPQDVVMH